MLRQLEGECPREPRTGGAAGSPGSELKPNTNAWPTGDA